MIIADIINSPEWREALSKQRRELKFSNGQDSPKRVRPPETEEQFKKRLESIRGRIEEMHKEGMYQQARCLYQYCINHYGTKMPTPNCYIPRELTDDEWKKLFNAILGH